MIRGVVNKNLVPIIPVGIKKLDGSRQEMDILMDTGSGHHFMLSETAAIQHGIAFRYNYDSSASIGPLPRVLSSMPEFPIWVELFLEGNQRVVKPKIIKADDILGVIGPSLLLNRRITIDVVEGGLVKLDWIPKPTRLARIRNQIFKPEPQLPSLRYRHKLPWTNLSVRGRRGEWQPTTMNVDTGDNGELSLPPSLVEEFGLWLPDKCQKITPDGLFDTICGDAEIFWQGKLRTVKCIQREEKNPPLIGMELLRGNRITIDVNVDLNYVPPRVEIARIPWSPSSNNNFLESSKDRLLHWFTGRSQ